MTNEQQQTERVNITPAIGINRLIDAANSNDRFQLLEDDHVLPANLTNQVHPIFHQLEADVLLQPMLQFASQFLFHDRLLEFFVPMLFGRELTDLQCKKTYLTDPLTYTSEARKARLITGVREALQCLAHRVEICFVKPKKYVYARTIAKHVAAKLTSSCCGVFQQEVSPKIEIANTFIEYYHDPNGYPVSSRCARFRHDFLFAITLVHEVVHAVGVMRRGHTQEPHYRCDYPETEWGYAWENFMFGHVINPQNRTKPGTHLLMRKIWADAKTADAEGGKEYCDVSMAWIAQWFRKETWDIVAKRGPTAIPPPTTHFKIQISHKLCAWVITSDCPDVHKDVDVLYDRWNKYDRQLKTEEPRPDGRRASTKIIHNTSTAKELQESNVPVPTRERQPAAHPCLIRRTLRTTKPNNSTTKAPLVVDKGPVQTNVPLTAVCRAASPCNARKRQADSQEDDCSPRRMKKR